MSKSFKTLNTNVPDLNRVQDNVSNAFKPLFKNPLLYGVFVKDVSLDSSGTTQVNHGLNKNVSGYLVTRMSASSNVWDSQETNNLKTKTLALNCSADVVVDLYIF